MCSAGRFLKRFFRSQTSVVVREALPNGVIPTLIIPSFHENMLVHKDFSVRSAALGSNRALGIFQ